MWQRMNSHVVHFKADSSVLKGEKGSLQHCENQLEQKSLYGDTGIWTQDLQHAKQTLYHWLTSPAEEHWESDTFEDHF